VSSLVFRAEIIAMTDAMRALRESRVQKPDTRNQNSGPGTIVGRRTRPSELCLKLESEVPARVKALYELDPKDVRNRKGTPQ